ncbi:hypothetical protein [Sunxiuqinia indica]|uniref:hypothetical protein n=1 Tax=Sunxiuqinia indica TaxID=2692584 RepID=UPI00135B5B83|nr:hypothetical protein [Sunxiuqinia indica]
MKLNDTKVKKLQNLIRDSFRIRPNHDPVYVDVSNHLERLGSRQHQIIFGRRGSGKSCLVVHFKNKECKKLNILPIYIDTDEIKRLGYPDILIRLILSVMEKTPAAKKRFRRIIGRKNDIQKHIDNLRKLLSQAENRSVKKEEKQDSKYDGGGSYHGFRAGASKSYSTGQISEFQEWKLDTLERYLSDYKQSLVDALDKTNFSSSFVFLDDYYLIKRDKQPDVIDYLHRLLRGTNYYLKVGTVRHRTEYMRNDGQTIGVELQEDIEEINLDRTLEDLNSTSTYISQMLNSLAEKVDLKDPVTELFNQQAFEKLVIASGGVPRDFLTIFVDAVDNALSVGREEYITPTNIWKAASSLSYRKKLKNLRKDASNDADSLERVYRDLMRFCLQEKKRTCFLISQDECQMHSSAHELIQQLMDFKLLHIVEPDTSAASGRKGRFEAYTLDFSLFMEPRKRNITIIEFWKFDSGNRRIGVREAPVYSLERASEAMQSDDNQETEELITTVEFEE